MLKKVSLLVRHIFKTINQFKLLKGSRRNYGKGFSIIALLVGLALLSSCGLLSSKSNSDPIDPPEDISFIDEDDLASLGDFADINTEMIDHASGDSVNVELYLLDKNGFVVPQTIALPNEEGIAKLALQSLVKNGPLSNLIPSGFQTVLPADTEVLGINVVDGVATVDLSKEFTEYQAKDEEKIMQSMTWTLTQFAAIDQVMLQINGHELTEMPVAGTPIGEGLTRKIGINIDTSDIVDVTNTKPLTVYYLGEDGSTTYYVPVTKRVNNQVENNIEAVVQHLIAGPSYNSNLLSDFLPDAQLIEPPRVADGKVTLNFNESLVNSITEENVVSEQMLTSLVLSLTEISGIDSVAVLVNGNDNLINSSGEKLSAPVTRPTKINAQGL